MKLNDTLKRYALYTLLYLCIFSAAYIGFSLINLSFDLKKWTIESRILLFLLPFGITLVKSFIDYILLDE